MARVENQSTGVARTDLNPIGPGSINRAPTTVHNPRRNAVCKDSTLVTCDGRHLRCRKRFDGPIPPRAAPKFSRLPQTLDSNFRIDPNPREPPTPPSSVSPFSFLFSGIASKNGGLPSPRHTSTRHLLYTRTPIPFSPPLTPPTPNLQPGIERARGVGIHGG